MVFWIAVFIGFASGVSAMVAGSILSKREIKGSCGGLSSIKDSYGQPMCECGSKENICKENNNKPAEALSIKKEDLDDSWYL